MAQQDDRIDELFKDHFQAVSLDSEDGHVARFYISQPFLKDIKTSIFSFPAPQVNGLTRKHIESMKGFPRYHVPYDPMEIQLWCIPYEYQVYPYKPQRSLKSSSSSASSFGHSYYKPKISVDISRLAYDFSEARIYNYVNVCTLAFDARVLDSIKI